MCPQAQKPPFHSVPAFLMLRQGPSNPESETTMDVRLPTALGEPDDHWALNECVSACVPSLLSIENTAVPRPF